MRKPLEKELKSYREQGISLYLNGILSNPKTIAKACQIAEGGGYMRDYVEDEKGRIARVDFDFVKEKVTKEKAARTDSESVPPMFIMPSGSIRI